jgi:hypothetical protein
MPRSLVAASEVGWFGVGGGGVGVDCCAAAGQAASAVASIAASKRLRWGERRLGIRSSLVMYFLARNVRHVAPQAQSESGISEQVSGQHAFPMTGRLTPASHTAVDVRSVGPDGRELGDLRVVGSEVAYRVGGGGVASKREGLAAAAAEI